MIGWFKFNRYQEWRGRAEADVLAGLPWEAPFNPMDFAIRPTDGIGPHLYHRRFLLYSDLLGAKFVTGFCLLWHKGEFVIAGDETHNYARKIDWKVCAASVTLWGNAHCQILKLARPDHGNAKLRSRICHPCLREAQDVWAKIGFAPLQVVKPASHPCLTNLCRYAGRGGSAQR